MKGGDMDGRWSGDDDDDGDDFPSPEAKTAPSLALPEKNRGGGGSATRIGKTTSSLGFFRHG
jgi:hypothetical protein